MDPSTYAAAIRTARKSLRLSVAKASSLVRVSPATIKRWESGKGLPPKSEIRAYLDNLGVPCVSPIRIALEAEQAPTGLRDLRQQFAERPALRLLRARRQRNNITLADLSAVTGLSAPSIHRYETGKRTPESGQLEVLALAVGCTEAETHALASIVATRPEAESISVQGDMAAHFLLPGNLAQVKVFQLLDHVVVSGALQASDLWEVLHGLLIMGEHQTIREIWPDIKKLLSQFQIDLENRVLIRSTLAMVRSTTQGAVPLDRENIRKIGSGVAALRPGHSRTVAMLHMVRLLVALSELEEAASWVRSVQDYADRNTEPATTFLVDLNRYAIDFEQTWSKKSLQGIEGLRSVVDGSLQAYNLDVALSHALALEGDSVSSKTVLADCYNAESQFGYGSPLARKVRSLVEVKNES